MWNRCCYNSNFTKIKLNDQSFLDSYDAYSPNARDNALISPWIPYSIQLRISGIMARLHIHFHSKINASFILCYVSIAISIVGLIITSKMLVLEI